MWCNRKSQDRGGNNLQEKMTAKSWCSFLRGTRKAFSKALLLLLVAALGGVAGVLILFESGLYPGHFDHQKLSERVARLREDNFGFLLSAVLLNALLENPPMGMRVVGDDGYGTGGMWTVDKSGKIRAKQYWTFRLIPPPNEDNWPGVSNAIKSSLYHDRVVGMFRREFGFEIDNIILKKSDESTYVSIDFVCFLSADDFTAQNPKRGGIIRDLFIWLGMFPKDLL